MTPLRKLAPDAYAQDGSQPTESRSDAPLTPSVVEYTRKHLSPLTAVSVRLLLRR
jgi:hypothetical protein